MSNNYKKLVKHKLKNGDIKIYNYIYKTNYNKKERRNIYLRKKLKSFNYKYNSKKVISDEVEIINLGIVYNELLLYDYRKLALILDINPEKLKLWIDNGKIPEPNVKLILNNKLKKYYLYNQVLYFAKIFNIYYKYNYIYDLRYDRSRKLKNLLFSNSY